VVGLVFEAWGEVDRVLDGLDTSTATRQIDGGSAFAWTLGHLTNQLDTWINVRLAHLPPNRVLDRSELRFGGTGAADNWDEIRRAVADVRRGARDFLEPLDDAALSAETSYAGSLAELAGRNVSMRYVLLRIAAHHYFHIGDIASVRSRRLGHDVGDYPGPLLACL
jgi:hypothetical protein